MSSTNTPRDFKEVPTDGKVRLTGVYLGIIKANNDSQRMGRLMVYIPELGGDESLQSNWYNVAYASPFAGATPLSKNKENGKEMKDTQISYGFWMVPPDVDNQVLLTFLNGDPAQGYWFACVYQDRMNHMVPGVALNKSTRDDINSINLPVVCEYNKKDSEVAKDYDTPKRPIFEPLHNCLDAQGLYADPERGPATTSARREAPSQVFGFCSPRSNTIHIDDDPDNEFIRLRTRSGAQILIHETTGYIYMISKEGNSWMEISDIGIDMYSKRSISMRAEENINLHADQSILTHGGGAVHVSGGTHTSNTSGHQHHKAAGKHKTDAQKGIKQNSKDDKEKKETKPEDDKKSADAEQKKADENGKTPTDGSTKSGQTPVDNDGKSTTPTNNDGKSTTPDGSSGTPDDSQVGGTTPSGNQYGSGPYVGTPDDSQEPTTGSPPVSGQDAQAAPQTDNPAVGGEQATTQPSPTASGPTETPNQSGSGLPDLTLSKADTSNPANFGSDTKAQYAGSDGKTYTDGDMVLGNDGMVYRASGGMPQYSEGQSGQLTPVTWQPVGLASNGYKPNR